MRLERWACGGDRDNTLSNRYACSVNDTVDAASDLELGCLRTLQQREHRFPCVAGMANHLEV